MHFIRMAHDPCNPRACRMLIATYKNMNDVIDMAVVLLPTNIFEVRRQQTSGIGLNLTLWCWGI
jgi:hypothetical protein